MKLSVGEITKGDELDKPGPAMSVDQSTDSWADRLRCVDAYDTAVVMPDHDLDHDLDRVERGEIPSMFGEISLTLPRGPVSQQAARPRKDELTNDLRKLFAKYQFFLTGDVQLTFEWMIHERARYESSDSADVDNILKPLLDAISGPDGILIDDCQVQAVTSGWIDWTREDEELHIRLRYIADEFVARASLAFVHVGEHLYLPVPTNVHGAVKEIIGKAIEAAVAGRARLTELGADWYSARMIMPAQRLFHRSRLGTGFRLGTLDDYTNGRL